MLGGCCNIYVILIFFPFEELYKFVYKIRRTFKRSIDTYIKINKLFLKKHKRCLVFETSKQCFMFAAFVALLQRMVKKWSCYQNAPGNLGVFSYNYNTFAGNGHKMELLSKRFSFRSLRLLRLSYVKLKILFSKSTKMAQN